MPLSHRIKLTYSQSAGPFDIYYRLNGELNFTLFLSNIYDNEWTKGKCIDLPSNAVEMKVVNKSLNSNNTVFKVIPH